MTYLWTSLFESMLKWLENFHLQTYKVHKLITVFGQDHFQKSGTIYSIHIYWASTMLHSLRLLLRMQRQKSWTLLQEDHSMIFNYRNRIVAAYDKEQYWVPYKVIINYYIILLQINLKKTGWRTVMSSLSLKSWIITFQGYLSNPIEGNTEYYIWNILDFYLSFGHFLEILKRKVTHWIKVLSLSYISIMGSVSFLGEWWAIVWVIWVIHVEKCCDL